MDMIEQMARAYWRSVSGEDDFHRLDEAVRARMLNNMFEAISALPDHIRKQIEEL